MSLRGIDKFYGRTKVIHNVDLDVASGEFLVFVGPSGCGKSTILRMIAGLEEVSGGEIRIGGVVANEVAPAQRGAAMVFQNYALYPHMTVAENMGFALKLAKVSRPEIDASVRAASEILRIEHLLDRKPKELSGGERQRVAIGRAIVRKPKVFLFDEPLSNLDAALRVQMRLELSRLHRELGTTMIYVTHDQVEAMTMGDRIAVFNMGRIEQIGPPADLYARPANQFVASFLGSPKMNFLKGTLQDRDGDSWRIATIGGLMLEARARDGEMNAGREVVVGVRPEHFEVVSPEVGVGATVSLIEHLGDCAILHVRVVEQEALIAIRVSAEESAGLGIGNRVGIRPRGAGCVVFGGDGRAMAYSGSRVRA